MNTHTNSAVLKRNRFSMSYNLNNLLTAFTLKIVYDVHTTEAVLQPNTCKSEPNIINLEHTEPAITLSPTHQSWVLPKVKKDEVKERYERTKETGNKEK